jgi:Leucine-rich repeat (LRR) protein
MCKLASAIISHKTGEVKVYDLTSHSDTYEHYKLTDTPRSEWREMHYLPSGVIECRPVNGDNLTKQQLSDYVRTGWQTYADFIAWAMKDTPARDNIKNKIILNMPLPEGLSVGEYLDLSGTQITALPEGLSVGGYLDLSGTQITALPEGLSVGGSLDLRGTQITALPEGLSVGESLDLRGTQITALPEGLSVGGSLDLSGTQITVLPKKLKRKVIR